ncbi:MAG: tRNA (adenosine(37)-N6)-threonylcarbamoyltransferase complex dimerization subunit type 1 TsaB [Pseudomonadota bacterium]|nr:tRNA (adenosine(37)-N6)-threonylcarbamoyltransferase complex dimerization subunit type 1 TsaB [Pseudomonadota bacterium]MDP1905186.1 tRNA (adenosine(37)-N6)-threonylcarbamoyltransferase complex dimerization subunit type 1 TsaB [Pseudomonadota bacterium]MDP2352958.1 tRNA (adenosine(37)-N6)-threonylcarbamoyltransferase complex dimerization subunit type 1 TsaB [Pseudomonadota bacterium]
MKLLAFDTASEWCTAALLVDGAVSFRAVHAGQTHSQLLAPMLGELLAEAGLSYRQLDGLVYGMGPGSFTGLRIACGVAQGLALGANLPVLGVSTLEALAEEAGNAPHPQPLSRLRERGASSSPPGKEIVEEVLACLDARMNEVYAALYRREGAGWRALAGPVVCPPQAAPLPESPGCIGAGPGFAAYPALVERMQGRLVRTAADAIPHARAIVRLAAPRYAVGEFGAPETAEPLYVRNKVALKVSER